MRQRGVIIEKTGKEVMVEIQDPARTCGSCKGCMRLTPEREPEDYVVRLKDARDEYAVGDQVILDGQIGPMIKAVGVLYGVPFVLFFVGYGITRLALGSDSLAGIGATGGLLLGALISKPLTRRFFQGEPDFRIVARACS